MSLKSIVAKLGGTNLVVSDWVSETGVATKADAKEFGLTEGKSYKVVVCKKDTTTKKGKTFVEGDYFFVEEVEEED
jgi:hypothetical protein